MMLIESWLSSLKLMFWNLTTFGNRFDIPKLWWNLISGDMILKILGNKKISRRSQNCLQIEFTAYFILKKRKFTLSSQAGLKTGTIICWCTLLLLQIIWSYSRTLNLQKKLFHLLQWKLLKIMKNAFYFILKALFILEIFKFCLDFLIM